MNDFHFAKYDLWTKAMIKQSGTFDHAPVKDKLWALGTFMKHYYGEGRDDSTT